MPALALSTFIVVLLGLAVLALLGAGMPRVLGWFLARMHPQSPLNTTPLVREAGKMDDATLAAIAYVLRAEADRLASPKLKVTLPLNPSPWALSGQMRTIPGRIKSV